MQNKKSIVLSSVKAGQQKAVLTLQEESDGIGGTVRLYNFPRNIDGICSLGVFHDGKVDKAGMTAKGHMLFEFFLPMKKIPENFSAAVVNFVNAEPSPILFGSSYGNDENVFSSLITEIAGQKSMNGTKEVLDRYGVDYADEEKAVIEKEIDEALGECEKSCENCIYKKTFYEQNSKNAIFEAKNGKNSAKNSDFLKNSEIFNENGSVILEEKNEKKLEKSEKVQPDQPDLGSQDDEKKDMFFDRLKPQIDKLFENNPTDENLQNLIPSSKWVRVEYEDEGDFFVFGLLFDENDEVKYVCYGVPAVFDEEPPEELSGYPIWLPLGEKDGFGYWLTYQDATTGEPVKAVIS